MAGEKEIGNLQVKIGLDSTGFQSGVGALNQQMKVVQSEFKAATAKLGEFGTGTDGLKLKAESLTKQMDLQQQKVSALQQAFEKSAASKGTDAKATQDLQIKLNKAHTELSNIENDLKKTTSEIKSQSTAIGRLGDDYKKSFDQAKLSMGNSFDQMKKVGAGITAAGAGIAVGLGAAVKTAADFDAQMSKVQALSSSTGEEFRKMRQQAIDLGAATSFSASQSAEGMQKLAAAGFNASQIMDAMPGVLDATAASGADMTLVAETMGAALNTFGLEASKAGHVADVLSTAANVSAIDVQDMAYSLKYAGPVAKSLGISLEEVSAAVVEMGNAGIKGEQAGTTLRSAMLNLIDPPKEAKKELDSLKVSIVDSEGKMRPLGNIIGQLNEKMKGMTEVQKAAALATIFGKEAVSGMMVLVDQGKDKFDGYTKSLKESDGAAKAAATTMKDNLKGAMDNLTGSLESASIGIGTALTPAIREVANYINDLVGKFNALSPATQSFIAISAAVTAGIALLAGPLLMLIGFIPSIAAGFSAISGAVAAAGGALAILTGPIGITIAAIIGLAALGILVYNNWEPIKQFFIDLWTSVSTWTVSTWESTKQYLSDTWNSIKATTASIWNGITEFFTSTWTGITSFLSLTWEGIKNTAANVWNAIVAAVMAIVNPFIAGVQSVFNSMKDGVSAIMNGVESFFSGIWEAIKNIFLGAILLILDLVTGNFTKLKSDAEQIWNNLKTAFGTIWGGIKLVFSGAISAITGLLSLAWNTISTAAKTIWNALKSFFATLWDDIKSAASNAWDSFKTTTINLTTQTSDGIKSIWDSILDFFRKLPGTLYDLAVSMFNRMKDGVTTTVSLVKKAIVDGIQAAITWITNLPQQAVSWGKNIIQGLIDGIQSMISRVSRVVGDLADEVARKIRNVLKISSPSRVMMEIGQFTGEGLALGMESTMGDISRQASKLAGATLPDISNRGGLQGSVQIMVTGNHLYNEADEDRLADKISRKFAAQFGLRVGGNF